MSTNGKSFYSHLNNQNILNSVMSHKILKGDEYQNCINDLIKFRTIGNEAESPQERARAKTIFRELKNKLIRHNMRFIIKFASRYKVSPNKYDDLISECVLGFDRSLERFDGSTKIQTYSWAWMGHYVRRNILHDHIVHYPQYVFDKGEVPFNNIEELDATDPEGNVFKILPDARPSAEELIHSVELSKIVKKLLSKLPKRERDIISHRFGFKGRDEKSCKKIGDIYGLSNQRIHQIEKKVLKQLKNLMGGNYMFGTQPKDSHWKNYPVRTCFLPEGKKYPCKICGEPIKQNQHYYDMNVTNVAHLPCVTGSNEIPKDAVKSKAVKRVRKSKKINPSLNSERPVQHIKLNGSAESLISKFPELDPNWSEDLQIKWFDIFERLITGA